MSNKVLWSGRFSDAPDEGTMAFTSSLSIDAMLAWYDAVGSVAHAKMLVKQKIIPAADGKKIIAGLKDIIALVEEDSFDFNETLEDVHSNIEFSLTEHIGEAGGRLHTARSRNDQVATDFRMFMRDVVMDTAELLLVLQGALIEKAKLNIDTVMPGFTHVQHAQPVSFGFHLMAHVFKIQRDVDRLLDSYKRLNISPLGSAALAGSTYPIDRHMTAQLLGFDGPTYNAMDSVSDRDFALEYSFCTALIMDHLSSMSEELVLWSSQEFGFVEIADAYSTGSSIMPQKKNPDVAELIRGRTASATGNLMTMLMLLKGLPLSYNRDLQEDKGTVIASYETVTTCLAMMAPMIATLEVKKERMLAATSQGFLNATDLADYLVTKGVPFRQAHEIVGNVVRHCIAQNKRIDDLSVPELKKFSAKIGKEVKDIISVESCMNRRTSYGGTAPSSVDIQIDTAEEIAKGQMEFCEAERDRMVKVWNDLLRE
ncbi:MAG: argininosuccinate lyase [Methanomassiliicoccales archaeon]|jgi:argininosuccinate lyase